MGAILLFHAVRAFSCPDIIECRVNTQDSIVLQKPPRKDKSYFSVNTPYERHNISTSNISRNEARQDYQSLYRLYRVFQMANGELYRLLTDPETDEELSLQLMRRNLPQDDFKVYIQKLDMQIFASVSSLAAIVNIARPIVKKYNSHTFVEVFNILSCSLKEQPFSIFFWQLRNFLTHANHAPWVGRTSISSELRMKFLLKTEILAEYEWKQHNDRIIQFLKDHENQLHLAPLLKEYVDHMQDIWSPFLESFNCFVRNLENDSSRPTITFEIVEGEL